MRAVAYCGVLEELQSAHLLQKVREFCGVSAGGCMAFLLTLGYSVSAITKLCTEVDFTLLPSVEPDAILDFFETFGIDTGESLRKFIASCLKHKGFGPETTFGELFAKTGRSLRIWATDMTHIRPVEFSANKTPTFPVATALYASMSYPFYLTPIRHPETGALLMDGGVMETYPIFLLPPEELFDTLGVRFVYKQSIKQELELFDILKRIISTHYKPLYASTLKQYQHQTIEIPCMEFPELHFQATADERYAIIKEAREATRTFLRSPPKRLGCQRRQSI